MACAASCNSWMCNCVLSCRHASTQHHVHPCRNQPYSRNGQHGCQLSRLKPDITHFLEDDSKAKIYPCSKPGAGSSKHLQTTDDLKPKSSHSSFSALGWGSDKGGAPTSLQQGVESSSSSFRGPHNSPGADSRDGDKAMMSFYMPALLCEDRLDFQHVFEDAVPGMPSARATFQV